METTARLASVAYLVGAMGNILGGYASGRLIKRGLSVDFSRKLIFTVGALICSSCTFLVPWMITLKEATLIIAVAVLGNNVTSCLLYAVVSDVFPESGLASVTGITGVGEGIVDMAMAILTGVIVDRFSFVPVFFSAAALPIVSIVALFLLVRRCELVHTES